MFSGALEKTNFLWQKERCRVVDTRDYFSCFLWGGEKARKKGKLNPHMLSLLKGPESKPETKLYIRNWQPLGALSSQPSLPEESPSEIIQPRFRKGLYLRGRGGNASPWARETKEELGMVTSEYQLGEVPPNPVHIHEEAKKPPRPVV